MSTSITSLDQNFSANDIIIIDWGCLEGVEIRHMVRNFEKLLSKKAEHCRRLWFGGCHLVFTDFTSIKIPFFEQFLPEF